jgi:hypothetical protein
MSQLPEYRVIFNPPPRFRAFGCAGILLFGWKTLLGL